MSCRKLAFNTIEQAERTRAIVHGIRGGAGKKPVRLYECPDCGMLHFTSKAHGPDTVAMLEDLPLAPPPLPPPPKPTGAFVKLAPKPKPGTSGRGEARKQEDAALIGLLGSDMRWFKLRFDEIANLLRAGRVEDAFVLASGCASFKRSFHPAKDEAATTAWLKEDDVKQRAFWRNEQAVRVPGSTEP